MLYRIGTKRELPIIASKVPARVFTEISQGIYILDAEYGDNRNYLQSGGYALIVETGTMNLLLDHTEHIGIFAHDGQRHPCAPAKSNRKVSSANN